MFPASAARSTSTALHLARAGSAVRFAPGVASPQPCLTIDKYHRSLHTSTFRCGLSSSRTNSQSHDSQKKKMSATNEQNDATLGQSAKSAADIAAGHAQYAQGAATSAIGSAMGSEEWKQSGDQTKDAAASAIREAAKQAPDGGKLGEAANQACPQTGEGVGSKGSE